MFVRLVEKMSRGVLGCLGSAINIAGVEAVNRTVGPERTPLEKHMRRMYARREEAWRPLNQARVVRLENARRDGLRLPSTARVLIETLRKRIIPFVHRRLVWTRDPTYWPMSMEHFDELDMFLADHLPRLWSGERWQMINHFYGEIKKRQEEERRLEEQEELLTEEANERNYLQWKILQNTI